MNAIAKPPAAAQPDDDSFFLLLGRAQAQMTVDNNLPGGSTAGDVTMERAIIACRARTPAGVAWKVGEVLRVLQDQEEDLGWWVTGMLTSVLEDLAELAMRGDRRPA